MLVYNVALFIGILTNIVKCKIGFLDVQTVSFFLRKSNSLYIFASFYHQILCSFVSYRCHNLLLSFFVNFLLVGVRSTHLWS